MKGDIMEFFTNSNKQTLQDMTEDGVIIRNDGDSLAVFLDGKEIGTVPLGASRIFRPDHDVMFVSDSGRVWKPES